MTPHRQFNVSHDTLLAKLQLTFSMTAKEQWSSEENKISTQTDYSRKFTINNLNHSNITLKLPIVAALYLVLNP